MMNQVMYLTKDGIEQIHQATLQVLSETGVKLTHPAGRDLLSAHGATLVADRILFPPDLVIKSLAQCPPIVQSIGRDPNKAFTLGDGKQFAHNTGEVPYYFETNSGLRRPATRQDNVKASQLADLLPHIDCVVPMFSPQDVDADLMRILAFYDALSNTTKPVGMPGPQSVEELRAFTEMIRIAFPDTELKYHGAAVSVLSPLIFPDDAIEIMMESARLGYNCGTMPAPTMGATAPLSIAGGLVQQNAEILAGIVLFQLVNPGLPVVYYGRMGIMEPRTGRASGGSPEGGIISAATVQLGHFYDLPVNVYGFTSDSTLANFQSAYERVLIALLPYLAGADMISGIGDMEFGMTGSLAQMALDNELMDNIRRLKRGVAVDEDSLAVDLIHTVIKENRNNYIAEKHTIRYLRGGEVMIPELAQRRNWTEWETAGCPDITLEADAYADRLLVKYDGLPLPEEQDRELLAVIRSFQDHKR